jgi:hypothetical protein
MEKLDHETHTDLKYCIVWILVRVRNLPKHLMRKEHTSRIVEYFRHLRADKYVFRIDTTWQYPTTSSTEHLPQSHAANRKKV